MEKMVKEVGMPRVQDETEWRTKPKQEKLKMTEIKQLLEESDKIYTDHGLSLKHVRIK